MKQNNLTQMHVKILKEKKSLKTGLQKNYILCIANSKRKPKNLQTRRLHTNTLCTGNILFDGHLLTPWAWVSFSNNMLLQNTSTASLNQHVKWIEYKRLYCIFSSWLTFFQLLILLLNFCSCVVLIILYLLNWCHAFDHLSCKIWKIWKKKKNQLSNFHLIQCQ